MPMLVYTDVFSPKRDCGERYARLVVPRRSAAAGRGAAPSYIESLLCDQPRPYTERRPRAARLCEQLRHKLHRDRIAFGSARAARIKNLQGHPT